MKRAASRSSAIINFDAINRRQFFRAGCNRHEKLAAESGVEFMAPVSGANFWSVCTRLKGGCRSVEFVGRCIMGRE